MPFYSLVLLIRYFRGSFSQFVRIIAYMWPYQWGLPCPPSFVSSTLVTLWNIPHTHTHTQFLVDYLPLHARTEQGRHFSHGSTNRKSLAHSSPSVTVVVLPRSPGVVVFLSLLSFAFYTTRTEAPWEDWDETSGPRFVILSQWSPWSQRSLSEELKPLVKVCYGLPEFSWLGGQGTVFRTQCWREEEFLRPHVCSL